MSRFGWWICRSIPKTLLRHHGKIEYHQQLVNIFPKSNHSFPKIVIYAFLSSKCHELHCALSSNPPECQDWGKGGGRELSDRINLPLINDCAQARITNIGKGLKGYILHWVDKLKFYILKLLSLSSHF